jgi:XTP/dITP diphosphohydrolase
MNHVLIATTNRGKLAEFRRVLDPMHIRCIDLSRFPGAPPCPETGRTFRANALQKAFFYHRISGLMTLAEDSGLEIEALYGDPGVYSARFAGESAGDQENIRKVLTLMADVPAEKRAARFVCVIAVVSEGKIIRTFRGTCRGDILFQSEGTGGFGYDPIFHYTPAGKSFAAMTGAEKNRVSHRGRALRALARYLKPLETPPA